MMENDNFPKLKLGNEIDGASQTLDLVETPLIVQLFQMLSLKYRDEVFENKLNEEFSQFQEQISSSLTNPSLGYLLDVSVFTDEFGNIILPYGQLVYPIGVGTEPIDALAESLRKPQIRPKNNEPDNFINNSFFIWVGKSDKEIKAKTIPKEFRQYLIDRSSNEADRRELLGKWTRVFPDDVYEKIARAEYWDDLLNKYVNQIQEEGVKKQISDLSREMSSLQANTNELYEKFQQIQQEISRNQTYFGVLATISSISGIIRSGIELNKLVCTENGGMPSGSKMKSPIDNELTIEITEQEISTLNSNSSILKIDINYKFKSLEEIDNTLNNLYKQAKIPIPVRDTINLPVLP